MSLLVDSSSPWSLSEAEFPIGGTGSERAHYLVRYAILAPSTKNTQPWKFAIRGDRIEILPDLTRWLRVSDPNQRELHISLGCALENLIVAADHFGYAGDVTYGATADGSWRAAASVKLSPAPVNAPRMRPSGLFEGLTVRHTIHGAFTARAVSAGVQRQLARVADDDPDVRLLLTTERDTARELASLSADADVAELGERDYRRELARVVGEGVFGTPWPVSALGRIVLPHLNNGPSVARRSDALMRDTPLLGLIATRHDDRASQVKAGQLFERVCLQATILGLHVHPMSQALQIPTLRARTARLAGVPDLHAQQLFRIGYATPRALRHTPRRAVERVTTVAVSGLLVLALANAIPALGPSVEVEAAGDQQPLQLDPARAALMKGHYHDAIAVQDAVIRGDVPASNKAAASLAVAPTPTGLPAAAAPFAPALIASAGHAAAATTVKAAADAVASTFATCGGCHTAAGVRPALPVPAPPDATGVVAHMLAHQSAIDRMQQGLILPSETLWRQGAEALKTAPLKRSDLPRDAALTGDIAAAEKRVHRMAEEAIATVEPAMRARQYAQLLTTCAECHSAHRTVWGPSRARPSRP